MLFICIIVLLYYCITGRCYDSADLYYKLQKGQIFTMENVEYVRDRDDLTESAFLFVNGSYTELDDFSVLYRCFADPSVCTGGLSLSFYIMFTSVTENVDTVIR